MLYDLNPNPETNCRIIVPINYLVMGFTKPTIGKPGNVSTALQQKIFEEMSGFDISGRLIASDSQSREQDSDEWYHAIRERILNG